MEFLSSLWFTVSVGRGYSYKVEQSQSVEMGSEKKGLMEYWKRENQKDSIWKRPGINPSHLESSEQSWSIQQRQ